MRMSSGSKAIFMKHTMKLFLAAILLSIALQAAEEKPATKGAAKDQLKELVGKIQAKMQAGKNTEADLGDELKSFDALLAEHKSEKTDDVAQILFMKAMLYIQVFENPEKGSEMIKQVQKDFPETTQGKDADKVLASIAKQIEGAKIQKELAVGKPFPDFKEKDLNGKPISVSAYKGKILLVDFWATWCGPCVGELPNVLKTYEKYHGKGFEIVGISLDQEEKKLRDFIKSREMPWQQYFDGKGWQSKLAGTYGIMSIPATYLLDKEGNIAAKNLRGDDLATEVGKLLAK
jgi:peroxiredoxin